MQQIDNVFFVEDEEDKPIQEDEEASPSKEPEDNNNNPQSVLDSEHQDKVVVMPKADNNLETPRVSKIEEESPPKPPPPSPQL